MLYTWNLYNVVNWCYLNKKISFKNERERFLIWRSLFTTTEGSVCTKSTSQFFFKSVNIFLMPTVPKPPGETKSLHPRVQELTPPLCTERYQPGGQEHRILVSTLPQSSCVNSSNSLPLSASVSLLVKWGGHSRTQRLCPVLIPDVLPNLRPPFSPPAQPRKHVNKWLSHTQYINPDLGTHCQIDFSFSSVSKKLIQVNF